MRGVYTYKRGRYSLSIWPPIRFTFERPDEDGWHMIGWAWTWRKPKRWTFPHKPDPNYGIILQGVSFGPIDWRRMVKRLEEH